MGARSYRSHSQRSTSSSSSAHSDTSGQSRSTAPTVHSVRPGLTHYETAAADLAAYERHGKIDEVDPRDSIATYASTIPSEEDLPAEPEYEVPNFVRQVYADDAIPSSPSEFAELFPSGHSLSIRHDDSTSDGNMNLRISTGVTTLDGHKQDMILFHLRMYDLKERQFSLRRYCRDSGREVCHTSRKHIKTRTNNKRPGLQRSISSALAGLRPRPDSHATTLASMGRRNSDLAEVAEEDDLDLYDSVNGSHGLTDSLMTNTTRLEFSNYAQAEVKRRGSKASRRYEFEYWGIKYQWRRELSKLGDGERKGYTYHLVNTATTKAVAHIVPEAISRMQAIEEEARGGWVPACKFWISDLASIGSSSDVAE